MCARPPWLGDVRRHRRRGMQRYVRLEPIQHGVEHDSLHWGVRSNCSTLLILEDSKDFHFIQPWPSGRTHPCSSARLAAKKIRNLFNQGTGESRRKRMCTSMHGHLACCGLPLPLLLACHLPPQRPPRRDTCFTARFVLRLPSLPVLLPPLGLSLCFPGSTIASFFSLIARQMPQRWVESVLWPVLGATAPIWTFGRAGRSRWRCDKRRAGSFWAAPSMQTA